MLDIEYKSNFLKKIKKIKDNSLKEQIKKQVEKVIENPKVGKPMRYSRKGTRELYISPYRLAYAYIEQNNKLIFLDVYHKDKQ
ncbi:type II toxin-antitoxin system mRNA interferase toxin, RelE/StbE family [Candidatus Woesearchaeota archaeon]|nr:type II toxin-antitoxin system mRNA interferase toxin, RelE/StbE family [Candidatus Woesearchaeota archaeon]